MNKTGLGEEHVMTFDLLTIIISSAAGGLFGAGIWVAGNDFKK